MKSCLSHNILYEISTCSTRCLIQFAKFNKSQYSLYFTILKVNNFLLVTYISRVGEFSRLNIHFLAAPDINAIIPINHFTLTDIFYLKYFIIVDATKMGMIWKDQEEATTSSTQISGAGDISIGSMYLIIFLFGSAGNILGFIWLWKVSPTKHNELYFRNIYRMMNILDCFICLSLVPEIETFLRGRTSVLFEQSAFCMFWALKWELLPSASVFIVAVLSVSRMVSVACPLYQLNFKALKILTVFYFLTIFAAMLVPMLMGLSDTGFEKTDGVCSLEPIKSSFVRGNTLIFITELGLPIVPIIVSAVITTVYLAKARARSAKVRSSVKLHNKATKTVVLVTATYMVCNVPCFINFVYFLYGLGRGEILPFRDRYTTTFLRWYVWNLTYVFSVALNASLNPVVYLVRMKQFRTFVVSLCGTFIRS